MHTKLQIVKDKGGTIKGIRDENGFLFFFPNVYKFPDQEARYTKEIREQEALAEYLLAALQERVAG